MLAKLTSQQWWAGSRHYITFFAGILATLGFVTATQQQGLITGLSDIVGGLERVVAGVVAVLAILGPIINGVISSRRASPVSKIQDVQAIATAPTGAFPASNIQTAEAKTALVAATNSIPEVAGVIMTSTPAGTTLSMSVPESTVTTAGTPQATKIAK